jgi:dipeptidyl aminopeptidase/acylaminoacyl peptidase
MAAIFFTTPRASLVDADAGWYASSGQLLFVRQGTLFAQPFDPDRLELSGVPIAIAEQVAFTGARFGTAAVSASAGTIAYRTSGSAIQRQFAWFDRGGKELGKVGDPNPTYGAPAISPDFRRLAFNRATNGNSDIWLLEIARGIATRFTSDPVIDAHPLWSPDGARIVFQKYKTDQQAGDLYQKLTNNVSGEELLLADGRGNIPTDWSSDGRFLLYKSIKSDWDIFALPFEGDRKPIPVIQTKAQERNAQFSPDGKWIAYESDDSGRFEIYVQPFPGPGRREQISNAGGAQVRWRADGKELFYIALDRQLMAVPIRFDAEHRSIEAAKPVPLFTTSVGDPDQAVSRQQYIVSPDGTRFLMNTVIGEDTASPITVILNWHPQPGK